MKVKIYTTPTCAWCLRTKTYLKDHNIKFKEVDVASDKEAVEELVEKSGQMAVPVIEIDGEIIVGFDQGAIDKALKIKN